MVIVYFQMLKGSYLCSQWWDLTNPYFNVCPDNLKELKNQIKNEGAKVLTELYSNILDTQVQLTL